MATTLTKTEIKNENLLGQLEDKLRELAGDFPKTVENPWWLEDADDDQEYCRDCIEALFESIKGDYPDAFIAGGYSGLEIDHPLWCANEKCDKRLECSLTDYGVETELEYYLNGGAVMPLREEDAYGLLDILQCMGWEERQKKYIKLWKRVAKELGIKYTKPPEA